MINMKLYAGVAGRDCKMNNKSKITLCIIASIVGRLIGFIAVLVFTYLMVDMTGKLGCLWLLCLLLAVDLIPTYEFKREVKDESNK